MKSWTVVAVVCLFVGQVSASVPVPIQNRYVYDLNAVVHSTSTNPANQFASVVMRGKVEYHAIMDHTALLKVDKLVIARLNDELTDLEPENIDISGLEKFEPEGIQRKLQIIYEENGKIQDVFADSRDKEHPETWNIKNALASCFQFPINESRENNILSDDNNNIMTRWENTIMGRCKATYTLEEEQSPYNATARIANITKYQDLSNCDQIPMFIRSSHQPRECEDCDTPDMFTTNIITNYDLVRKGNKYIIESIEKEATSLFAPVGLDVDYYEIKQKIKLDLVEVHFDDSTLGGEVAGGGIGNKEQDSLNIFYRYKSLMDRDLPEKNLKKANPRLLNWYEDGPLDYANEFTENLMEAVKDIVDEATDNNKDIPPKLMRAAMAAENLNYDQLMQVNSRFASARESSPEAEVAKQLFYDVLSIAGTNPAFLVGLEAIEKGDLKGERAVQFIQQLSSNHKAPSAPVIEKLMQFCECDAVKRNFQMWSACWLVTGTMIAQGGVHGVAAKPTPPIVDRLCTKEETASFVDRIGKRMEAARDTAKKLVFIGALGNTGSRIAVNYLKPLLNGKDTLEYSDIVQIKAIYAVLDYGILHPKEIINLMLPIIYNTAENSTVKAAAVNVLIHCRPTFHIFEKLATYTWRNDDEQLNAYLYSCFDSLANTTDPCLKQMSSHAQHALNLMDDECEDGYGVGAYNLYESDTDDDMLLDSFVRLSYVGEDSSPIFFEKLHAALIRNVNGYRSKFAEISMNAVALKSLFNHIIGPKGAFKEPSKKLLDILADVDSPNINKGFDDIMNKLNIEPREDDETEMLISTTFLGDQKRQFYFNMEDLQQYARKAMEYLPALRSQLQSGIPLNYNKVIRTYGFRMATPTIVGLPFYCHVRKFDFASLRGDVTVQYSSGLSAELNLQAIATGRLNMLAGVAIPHVKVLAVAGYCSQYALTAPFSLKASVERSLTSVKLEVQCTANDPEVPLVYIRTKPYTVLYKYTELKPIMKYAKFMTILDSPRTDEFEVGKQIMKSPIKVTSQHEIYWNDKHPLRGYLDRFGLMGIISFPLYPAYYRMRKYEVLWTESEPIATEIELQANTKLAESQPELHPITSILGIWGRITPWSRVPVDCKDDEESQMPWEVSASVPSRKQSRSYGARSAHKPSYDRHESSFDSEVRKLSSWKARSLNDDDDVSSEEEYSSFQKHGKSTYSELSSSRSASSRPASSRFANARYAAMEGRPDFSGPNPIITERPYAEGELVKKVNMMVKLSGLKVQGFKSDIVCRYDFKNEIRKLDVTTTLLGSQKQICLEAKSEYVKPPCRYGPKIPQAAADDQITHKVKVSWGEGSCSSGFIDIKRVLKKSEDQLKYEDSDAGINPWFYDQCQKDQALNNHVSYACDLKAKHLLELHSVTTTIKYQNVPLSVQNKTIHSYDYIKSMFYPYMSRNPFVSNPENEITIKHLYHYEAPASTIKVMRPSATAHFYKVPWEDFDFLPFELTGPPSLRYSRLRLLADYYTGEDTIPDCQIAENYVRTFDNATYEMEWSDCEYVLAKDCSGSNLFSVIIEKKERNQVLKVRSLKHEVHLNVASPAAQKLKINGHPRQIDSGSIQIRHPVYNKTTMVIYADQPRFYVVLPLTGVVIQHDGHRTKVMASHFHRSDVCGLCGTFNGDADDDFTGPQNYEYATGEEFAHSYAIPSSKCNPPKVTDVRMSDDTDYAVSVNVHKIGYRTLYKDYGNKICFTVEPYPKCINGSTPTFEKLHEVDLTCYKKKDPLVSKWKRRVDNDELIEELLGDEADITDVVLLPEYCSS